MKRRMAWWFPVSVMVLGTAPLTAQSPLAGSPDGPASWAAAATGQEIRASAPRSWAPQDPADSIYRQARQSLNRGAFEDAALLFSQIRADFPTSDYAPDAYYWEAFARYRIGSRSELRQARGLLTTQADQHPDAATRGDADGLLVQIAAQLARTGDADAFQSVTGQAAQACDEGEQELKSMALSALMNMDSERAVPILRDVLQDRSQCSAELRAEAVFILGQKMTDDVIPLIMDLAVNNPDPSEDVREAAVFALSQVRGPEAEAALERILTTSADTDVQEQALFAMSQRSSDRSSQILRDYASNPAVDPDLRETAIFWIGQKGGGETFDFLDQIFDSADDEDVKEAVVFAMTQSSDPRVAGWLLDVVRDANEDMDVRENALFWYGQRGAGVSVDELMALFRELPEEDLKESILYGLAQRKNDDAALEALIEIARTEENPEIVESALFWLGQSDDPRAMEVLLEIIRR